MNQTNSDIAAGRLSASMSSKGNCYDNVQARVFFPVQNGTD